MSSCSSRQAVLILGAFWLAACADDATEPSSTPQPDAAISAAATSGSWLIRANMPANRSGPATAALKNAAGEYIVYTIGGLNPKGVPVRTVTAYNVTTNTWTFRRQLPVPLAGTNGAGVIGGKIYVSGGYSDVGGDFPSLYLFMYDPATNTWTRKHDMPVIRGEYGESWIVGTDGVTGVIGGKLYVATACYTANEPWGYDEGCPAPDEPRLLRYNPVADQWTLLPSPSFTNAYSPFIGGVIDGKFYVMDGRSDPWLAAYDPATNNWTPKTPLGLSRPGAAAAVMDAKLFLFGGTRYNSVRDAWETLDVTIVYDPVTDAWTQRAPMPSPRTGMAAVRVFVDGKPRVEVVGGNVPGNNLQYVP